jgi:hypothetical protein
VHRGGFGLEDRGGKDDAEEPGSSRGDDRQYTGSILPRSGTFVVDGRVLNLRKKMVKWPDFRDLRRK